MNENEDVNHSYSISHPPPGYKHTPLDLAILRQGDPADAFYAEAESGERNKERAGSEPQLTRGDDGQADGANQFSEVFPAHRAGSESALPTVYSGHSVKSTQPLNVRILGTLEENEQLKKDNFHLKHKLDYEMLKRREAEALLDSEVQSVLDELVALRLSRLTYQSKMEEFEKHELGLAETKEEMERLLQRAESSERLEHLQKNRIKELEHEKDAAVQRVKEAEDKLAAWSAGRYSVRSNPLSDFTFNSESEQTDWKQQQKRLEEEVEYLEEQLRQKDNRLDELEAQLQAETLTPRANRAVGQDEEASLFGPDEEFPFGDVRGFTPTKRVQERINELVVEIELEKKKTEQTKQMEKEKGELQNELQTTQRGNGLDESLIILHEATAYALNDVESAYDRLQQMKISLLKMFERLKSSAGLFEEILQAIGDHSDLANRIKQLNLELSFGMQPPRDLLDVINEMEKSFGVMRESLRQINTSVMMQSSFVLDISKRPSLGRPSAAAVLNVFGGMIEERQPEQEQQEQKTKTDANEEALYSLISEKEHQCQQLEAQYNMAMNSIGELQASIQRLSAELGTASNEIATKDDKISELRKELDARLEEFNKLRSNSPALRSADEKLQAAQREIDRLVAEKEEEIEGARRREEMMDRARKELQEEYDLQRKQMIDVASELVQLQEESEKLQKELEERDEQRDRQREYFEQMQEKHKVAERMCKELAEEIKSIRSLYDKTKKELEAKQRETETAGRQREEAEQRMVLLQQAETELHRLQTAHRQLRRAVICSVFEDRPLAEATVMDKEAFECGDDEIMKKLDEARTTREELLGMLTEARKQLEIKVTRSDAVTVQPSQPVSSRCPSATSTTPSTAPCHSPGFFVPTACAAVPFHNNSAESRSACDSLRSTKTVFPPHSFLSEATIRMDNVVQEVKELARGYDRQEQEPQLANRITSLIKSCRDVRAFIHERLKSARAENELRKVDSSDLVNRAMDLISRNSYLEARVQQLEADHNKKLMNLTPKIKNELEGIENVMKTVESNLQHEQREQRRSSRQNK
ncbi:hypothetical protein WR25_06646 [Diploscapter pachys]|uniref:Uncharacterized protein n=1 Tax=Diploscapter pachys TaxID=2018661 RepID=A0A2A2JUI9_9BILA|nr:hypothetical protein WR25_06646 [Diploscapter pachys]